MNGKISFLVKLGSIFAVVAIAFSMSVGFGFWLIENGMFQDLGFYFVSLGEFFSFPLIIISFISNESILYLSNSFTSPIVAINFYGYLVIFVFWFLVGGLIGWFTRE